MGIMSIFIFIEAVKKFAITHHWVAYVLLIPIFISMIVLACFTEARRTLPWNFLLLGFYTLLLGSVLGFFSAAFEITEVLIAVGITAVVCLALTIFACQVS